LRPAASGFAAAEFDKTAIPPPNPRNQRRQEPKTINEEGIAMAYQRTAARRYAHKHWDIPCDDGLVAVKSSSKGLSMEEAFRKKMQGERRADWQAAFLRNVQHNGTTEVEACCFIPTSPNATYREVVFATWSDLNDCAHYVLKCLQAGGIRLKDIGGVPILEQELRKLLNTRTLADRVPSSAAKRILETGLMKKGDVIAYCGKNGFFHSSLYLGNKKIACHTTSRWESDWNLYSKDRVSLIHFSDDDPAPSTKQASWLPGWWEVIWKSTRYYYYYSRSGRVSYTKTRPKSLKGGMVAPMGKGYWFRESADQYVIIWMKTGSVERFLLVSKDSQDGKWNGQDRLTSKKLGP
jgi:hypothetical protein